MHIKIDHCRVNEWNRLLRGRPDPGQQAEGDPQNVLNFGTLLIRVSSDIMLHIGALNALAPRGSDLTAKN